MNIHEADRACQSARDALLIELALLVASLMRTTTVNRNASHRIANLLAEMEGADIDRAALAAQDGEVGR